MGLKPNFFVKQRDGSQPYKEGNEKKKLLFVCVYCAQHIKEKKRVCNVLLYWHTCFK